MQSAKFKDYGPSVEGGTKPSNLPHIKNHVHHDPNRCSIGFHPLHTTPAIVIYATLFVLPLSMVWKKDDKGLRLTARVLHLVGLGLLIHMALDWIDCMV